MTRRAVTILMSALALAMGVATAWSWHAVLWWDGGPVGKYWFVAKAGDGRLRLERWDIEQRHANDIFWRELREKMEKETVFRHRAVLIVSPRPDSEALPQRRPLTTSDVKSMAPSVYFPEHVLPKLRDSFENVSYRRYLDRHTNGVRVRSLRCWWVFGLSFTGVVESEHRARPLDRGLVRFTVPLWMLCVLFAAYPTVAFICGPLRRYRRRRKGMCLKCGYDLTGNVSGVCPECGVAT